MNRYGRKGDPSKRSRAEAIIDAGNAAYADGQQALEHVQAGDAFGATALARCAARSAIEAMRLITPIRCCGATHYAGEDCATFGASVSQIEVA